MKSTFLVCVVLSIGVVAGCGGASAGGAGDDGADAGITTSKSTYGATVFTVPSRGAKPTIHVPAGPPPKNLVVKVLRKGTAGPRARWGDRIGVRFLAAAYATRRIYEDRWNQPLPFAFRFGDSQVRKGWEIGLKGMRLGDRRELKLPSRLAYGNGALVYVVELVEIEPRTES